MEEKEKELLENIIELNPYPILICDAEGHHERANPAWFKVFGFARLLNPEEYSLFKDPLIKESIAPVLEGKTVKMPPIIYNSHKVVPNVKPELPSADFFLSSVVFPVMDQSGKLKNIVIMFEDITEQKKLENDLKLRLKELDKFNQFLIGREVRMAELKKKVRELEKRCGIPVSE